MGSGVLAAILLSGMGSFGPPEPLLANDAPSPAPAVFHYDAKRHRDPFVPLVQDGRIVGGLQTGRGDGSSTPVLYGIVWEAGGESVALIDDRQVRVGDAVDDYEVVAIQENAVVLSKGGESLVLRMAFEHAPAHPPSRGTKRR